MVSIRRSFEAYVDDMNIITVLIPAEQKEIMTPPFRLEKKQQFFLWLSGRNTPLKQNTSTSAYPTIL